MEDKIKNKRCRNFSHDLDFDSNSIDYYTIQSMNKTSRNNFYSTTISTQTNQFLSTKTNSFLNRKAKLKLNLKLLNYHKNYLHERIQLNKKFQHLFITEKKIPFNKVISPFSTYYSKSTQGNTTITPYQEKRTSIYSNKEKSRNITLIKVNKTENNSNRFYKFFPSARSEKLGDFKKKINDEIKGKYILYQKKDFCDKLEKNLENKIDQYKQNIKSLNITGKLYNSYIKTYDNYEKKIDNVLTIEIDKNENYKQIIYQLKSDIARIKIKISKLQVQLQENFQTKCFLLCVKNSTRLVHKFSPNDLEELKYDNLLISYHLGEHLDRNNNSIERKNSMERRSKFGRRNSIGRRNSQSFKTSKSYHRASTIFSFLNSFSPKKHLSERKLSISSIGKIIENQKPKFINKIIFNDPKEFVDHLDSITDNISKSLNIYNNIREEINYLKHELVNVQENKNMKKYVKLLNEDIEIAEEKYLNYKRRNEDLKNTFNYLSLQNNKANKKFNNLQQRINNMYLNVSSFLKFYKDISQLTDLQILNLFEKCLNTLMMKQNNLKIKFPNEYKRIVKEIDKKKKEEQTKNHIIKQKEKLNEKIMNVIEKSNKILFKPKRNIGNNIYLMEINNRNKNKNKSNVKKENPYELLEY